MQVITHVYCKEQSHNVPWQEILQRPGKWRTTKICSGATNIALFYFTPLITSIVFHCLDIIKLKSETIREEQNTVGVASGNVQQRLKRDVNNDL